MLSEVEKMRSETEIKQKLKELYIVKNWLSTHWNQGLAKELDIEIAILEWVLYSNRKR